MVKKEVFTHLSEVFECGAFELCRGREENEYLIPYMMNDALEYYFVLQDCRLTGEYLPEAEIESVQMDQEEERFVLIIRQSGDNTCTLLFREIREEVRCYQYHAIGHFWAQGQEQWRQLVYIIGTIYDKYEFFGERFCTEKEREIMHLIRFAPFRMWSPIRDSLKERYPDSREGLEVMKKLAARAGDSGYQRLLKLYRFCPVGFLADFLGQRLTSPKRQRLYEVIWQKVEEASLEYPCRDYGEELNAQIQKKREETDRMLKAQGFQGTYPLYNKEGIGIVAAEEHPFTILEWEDYVFRIRLMVSNCKEIGRNAGFFRGKDRKGWIVSAEEWK